MCGPETRPAMYDDYGWWPPIGCHDFRRQILIPQEAVQVTSTEYLPIPIGMRQKAKPNGNEAMPLAQS
jgi:hypothetical protein